MTISYLISDILGMCVSVREISAQSSSYHQWRKSSYAEDKLFKWETSNHHVVNNLLLDPVKMQFLILQIAEEEDKTERGLFWPWLFRLKEKKLNKTIFKTISCVKHWVFFKLDCPSHRENLNKRGMYKKSENVGKCSRLININKMLEVMSKTFVTIRNRKIRI